MFNAFCSVTVKGFMVGTVEAAQSSGALCKGNTELWYNRQVTYAAATELLMSSVTHSRYVVSHIGLWIFIVICSLPVFPFCLRVSRSSLPKGILPFVGLISISTPVVLRFPFLSLASWLSRPSQGDSSPECCFYPSVPSTVCSLLAASVSLFAFTWLRLSQISDSIS